MEPDKMVFNYPVEIAAVHREGRCINSNKIWVQGLPMDIAQAIDLIDVSIVSCTVATLRLDGYTTAQF
jgi:hypothetical protein